MVERLKLNLHAEEIILDALKLQSLDQVLDRDYADLSINNDSDREQAKKYSNRFRGSVRLVRGKFYTEEEIRQRRNRIDSLKLP